VVLERACVENDGLLAQVRDVIGQPPDVWVKIRANEKNRQQSYPALIVVVWRISV
jgi:hypothetical protein